MLLVAQLHLLCNCPYISISNCLLDKLDPVATEMRSQIKFFNKMMCCHNSFERLTMCCHNSPLRAPWVLSPKIPVCSATPTCKLGTEDWHRVPSLVEHLTHASHILQDSYGVSYHCYPTCTLFLPIFPQVDSAQKQILLVAVLDHHLRHYIFS